MWLPLASLTSINKLQIMRNAALRTATGCTQDTNIYMTKHSYSYGRYTTHISTDPHTYIITNMRHIHTSIVSMYLASRINSKILRPPPPHIISPEELLPRRTLAQLRTNKSPFLKSYLHKFDAKSHQSQLCPLCNTHIQNTHNLFNCTHKRTSLSPLDLWTYPTGVTARLSRWTEKLAGGPHSGIQTPSLARVMGVGRQQKNWT